MHCITWKLHLNKLIFKEIKTKCRNGEIQEKHKLREKKEPENGLGWKL